MAHSTADQVTTQIGGGYSKLFPGLSPLRVNGVELSWLGRRGGYCDLGTDTDDSEDSGVDAVWPFFGQFVAHDITADRSPLDAECPLDEISNFRTPRVDLAPLYGAGATPYMYERSDPAKLLLAPSGHDLARNQDGLALIGDARNDSHLFISQLHLAFAKLHNRLVDRLRHLSVEETEIFERARQVTISLYQHIILREFLPQVIGSSLASELSHSGPKFFDVADGRIPLEFAAAAYRYGHAQIRQRYRVNAHFGPVPMFPDLVGFRPVGLEHAVDWSLQIGLGAQKAKRIDMRLPRALIELPPEVSGCPREDRYSSLAARDLARGQIRRIASGEAIAREMGITPLDAREIGLAAHGWQYETPLWLYVLREAELLCGGDRLGPVGGRIVGEVLVGIIDRDLEPFPALEPEWHACLGEDGNVSLAGILGVGHEPSGPASRLANRAGVLADASAGRLRDPRCMTNATRLEE